MGVGTVCHSSCVPSAVQGHRLGGDKKVRTHPGRGFYYQPRLLSAALRGQQLMLTLQTRPRESLAYLCGCAFTRTLWHLSAVRAYRKGWRSHDAARSSGRAGCRQEAARYQVGGPRAWKAPAHPRKLSFESRGLLCGPSSVSPGVTIPIP